MHFRFRTHAIDVVGPLTVRDVLKAVGDAQQFEYVRNTVLEAWLSRHLPDAHDDEPKRPVDLIALNPDFAQAFMGRMVDHSIPGRKGEAAFTYKASLPLTPVPVPNPPAPVDPTAGMDVDALVRLLGGEEVGLTATRTCPSRCLRQQHA